MKVVFPYFAQLHQVFHSLPIAAEMAIRHPEVEVHVAGATAEHLAFVHRILEEHAPQAPLQIDALKRPWLMGLPHKKRTMFKNRHYFQSFDAIVTPERTSLFLRRLIGSSTRLIWTRHGAGDRAIGFSRDIRGFDYVLMAGKKIEQRLLAAGLVRPGAYTSGVYAKFDWLKVLPIGRPLFTNGRPTVLYNPHFDPALSSWPHWGQQVLEYFAASERYNLIFAPHVRLFDPPEASKYEPFRRYLELSHVRVDLGSCSSVDMSYIKAADLYLGDVSSQVAEFLCRPRPCLFLNAQQVDWRGSADYRFWTLGPVLDRIEDLDTALHNATAAHPQYLPLQEAYVAETFGLSSMVSSAARGADAIIEFLRRPGVMPAIAG